jgi:hypothetical protein
MVDMIVGSVLLQRSDVWQYGRWEIAVNEVAGGGSNYMDDEMALDLRHGVRQPGDEHVARCTCQEGTRYGTAYKYSLFVATAYGRSIL